MRNFISSIMLFLMIFLCGQLVIAQSPGGVNSSIGGSFLWLKANDLTSLTLDASNTKVIDWKDQNSAFSANQIFPTLRPNYQQAYTSDHDFNFNPFVDFNSAASTRLVNGSGTQNYLTPNSCLFIVNNSIAGNGSGLTYRGNNNSRYQYKPHWRSQNGQLNIGYVSDFGTGGGGPTNVNFPLKAARIATNRFLAAPTNFRINASSYPVNLSSSIYFPSIQTGLCIGANTSSEFFNDGIAEIIIYPNGISIMDVNRVESYLAMKYGITLDSASAQNYRLSDTTIIWNAMSHPDFHHRITAIVRDDSSGLMQKQSSSVHNGSLIDIFYGNTAGVFPAMNDSNASTFGNMEYLLIGDNAESTNLTECFSSDYMARMKRLWIARQSLNYNDLTTIRAEIGDLPPSAKNIIVSPDPTFPIANTTIYPLIDDGIYLYAAVALGDSLFFTYATDSLSNTFTVTPAYCTSNSGTAQVMTQGGAGNYQYSWFTAPTQTSNPAVDLPSGPVTMEVSHGDGCIVTDIVSVTSATYNLNITDQSQNETCTNSNGSILLNANNSGQSPYMYSIDGGTNFVPSNNFRNLSAGAYPILVEDAYGCTNLQYVVNLDNIINEPEINYTLFEPSCFGYDDGAINIVADQSLPPYSYTLQNPNTMNRTGMFTGLSSGSYVFTIRDAINCHLDTTIYLDHPSKLSVSADAENSCWLDKTGKVTLSGQGGTPPYEYAFTNAVFSYQVLYDSLSPGNKIFYIRDDNNCLDSTSVNIDTFKAFKIDYETIDVDCQAWNQGGIVLHITEGNGPYNYTWDQFPGEIIGDQKLDLNAGNYSIEIHDVNLCRDTINLLIDNNCCKPFVPTAFTPNSDGLNDRLVVKSSPDMEILEFEIFNRYGQSVYHTISPNPVWDGKFDQKDVDVDTYTWIAEVICTKGREKVTGNFHLLR